MRVCVEGVRSRKTVVIFKHGRWVTFMQWFMEHARTYDDDQSTRDVLRAIRPVAAASTAVATVAGSRSPSIRALVRTYRVHTRPSAVAWYAVYDIWLIIFVICVRGGEIFGSHVRRGAASGDTLCASRKTVSVFDFVYAVTSSIIWYGNISYNRRANSKVFQEKHCMLYAVIFFLSVHPFHGVNNHNYLFNE